MRLPIRSSLTTLDQELLEVVAGDNLSGKPDRGRPPQVLPLPLPRGQHGGSRRRRFNSRIQRVGKGVIRISRCFRCMSYQRRRNYRRLGSSHA